MTLALISTTRRHTQPDQPSGNLFVYDLELKRIIRKSEIVEPPYRDVDTNPRGGLRGLKGISIEGNRVALANASTVFLYDHHWNPLAYTWHPSCAGIHDIRLQGESVWTTSSRNDLLILLDFKGDILKYYDLRRFDFIHQRAPRLSKPFLSHTQIMEGSVDFRDPRNYDHTITDSLHVNSLVFLQNGDCLVSCGLFRIMTQYGLHKINNLLKKTNLAELLRWLYRSIKKALPTKKNEIPGAKSENKEKSISMIVRLRQDNKALPGLEISGSKVPSHSIRLLQDNSAIYLNTTTGEIIHFDPENDTVYSSTVVGSKFLRGARQLPDGTILIGDNNFLIHFDLAGKKVLSKTLLIDDPSEAIFDINILPGHFELPPESFIQLHKDKLPVYQVDNEKVDFIQIEV